MKKLLWIFFVGFSASWLNACSDANGRYIDLSTGKPVKLEKDELAGVLINKETKQPVYMYVDTRTNDTIYGSTGEVINGHIYKDDNDKYVYDNDEKLKTEGNGEVKYKDGDYKVKVEKDGDMTIKNGDKKVEIDGKTDERKVKKD